MSPEQKNVRVLDDEKAADRSLEQMGSEDPKIESMNSSFSYHPYIIIRGSKDERALHS